MKVLVTGSEGQLGSECMRLLVERGIEAIGTDIRTLDLCDLDSVPNAVASYGAQWIIHCAAYTQVDRAEGDAERAFCINRDSSRAVAEGAQRSGSRMVYVSTDFVFSGDKGIPYDETDAPAPLSVYGRSKWEGEQVVLEALPDALVFRTGWVYGVHGNNFVKAILRLAAERDRLTIVDDQVGTPTWTADIADALITLMERDVKGVVHFTNEGVASWYDFAVEVYKLAQQYGVPLKAKSIVPISSRDYPAAAQRPHYSVMSKVKVRSLLKSDIPHWRTSLERMLMSMRPL